MTHHPTPQRFNGTERELAAMATQLNELHHDLAVLVMRDGMDNVIQGLRDGAQLGHEASRRTFLRGAGVALDGGAALLSVGAPSIAGAVSRPRGSGQRSTMVFPPAGLKGDLAVAAVAASLENLAVFAYTAGINATTAGSLGPVPPAVATFAVTARARHVEHAAAWNAVLHANGKAKVALVNPMLAPMVQADFAKVTDVVGLANLALTLEMNAAETYQVETSKLMSSARVALSASIAPVEMQHIAILYYVLGKDPGAQNAQGVPVAFSATAKAV